jgi:hypothetical protein
MTILKTAALGLLLGCPLWAQSLPPEPLLSACRKVDGQFQPLYDAIATRSAEKAAIYAQWQADFMAYTQVLDPQSKDGMALKAKAELGRPAFDAKTAAIEAARGAFATCLGSAYWALVQQKHGGNPNGFEVVGYQAIPHGYKININYLTTYTMRFEGKTPAWTCVGDDGFKILQPFS